MRIDCNRDFRELLYKSVNQKVKHLLTRTVITCGIPAGVILAPFPDTETADKCNPVRVVEFLCKIVNELRIALLENRIVRIRSPDSGTAGLGLKILATPFPQIFRTGRVVFVLAICGEIECKTHIPFLRPVDKHLEPLCLRGVAVLLPDIYSRSRIRL